MKTCNLDLSSIPLNNDSLSQPFKKNIDEYIGKINTQKFIKDLNIDKIYAYRENEEREFDIAYFLSKYRIENFEWYASSINIYDQLEFKSPNFLNSWTYYLPTEIELKWLWLFIGPAKSYTPLHIDTMNSGAWNLLLEGSKEWIFYSPNCSVSKELLPKDFKSHYKGEKKEISFIQNAGDIVYTPSSWSHKVSNITPTISITGNFINSINVNECINYLRCTQENNWYEIIKFLKSRLG
ncbi:hypothetical protein QNJ28_10665 [Macrococcus caseolyticus]|uniref:JmjC domain-containing protein n=1 Tax=Macrococcoides caseolyticum TaxID=69966 RepID=UPI0024BCCA4E|nr:cupin domain-containing protein [Macrococcus caseolyticus]MDJ1110519.1 hypothetical protein [Macrococcus caseolyticus]